MDDIYGSSLLHHVRKAIETPSCSLQMRIKFSWDKDAVAMKPLLVLTAKARHLDPIILTHWKEEGFEVIYLPYTGTREEYGNRLKHLSDPLELGEMYAIVGASP